MRARARLAKGRHHLRTGGSSGGRRNREGMPTHSHGYTLLAACNRLRGCDAIGGGGESISVRRTRQLSLLRARRKIPDPNFEPADQWDDYAIGCDSPRGSVVLGG